MFVMGRIVPIIGQAKVSQIPRKLTHSYRWNSAGEQISCDDYKEDNGMACELL